MERNNWRKGRSKSRVEGRKANFDNFAERRKHYEAKVRSFVENEYDLIGWIFYARHFGVGNVNLIKCLFSF